MFGEVLVVCREKKGVDRVGGREEDRKARTERGRETEGWGGGEGEERLLFGEKWKFNQISFYSANRKSVLSW